MLPDNYLRPLVHLDHEQRRHSIRLIAAPTVKNSPKLFPVHGVVSFLQVDQGRIVFPLLTLPMVDML